ncbi:DUF2059 domain-containing protein [Shimia biformata]|uniref:DUF2059 domain-containing protein n=1 Tax=Shimia biformata TaxID=1294299 RepID=UPI001951E5FB|nr:DUF2059 domain-containing protein [Shimia biformata]
MQIPMPFRVVTLIAATLIATVLATQLRAADRARVEEFLEITGFDVALDSIELSASAAPAMLGLEEDAFGADWVRLSKEVFAPEIMRERATDILSATLTDDLLDHANSFYASDLGQRLVQAENLAHYDDDELIQEAGERIVSDLVRKGASRLDLFRRMNHAVDPQDIGPRAVQEIQVRFLVAASLSGVINLRIDEEGLRALLKENESELRVEMAASALANSAYTYQQFSDDELEAYTEALEHPDMQTVYELMNAVHFEVMSNRFEVLARRMGELHPGEEL